MTHSDLDLLGDVAEPDDHQHIRRRPGRSIAALLVVLLMVGGLAGGVWYGGSRLLSSLHHSTPDYAGAGSGSVTVVVEPGETATQIAGRLLKQGVVRSVAAFVAAADADPASRSLQPGTFRLRSQMKASSALALLLNPASRIQSVIVLPEGFSVTQILARIAARTNITLPQLRAAAHNPASLGLPAYARGRLEGFLYPATYNIPPGTPATGVLRMMVAKFNEVAATERLTARAQALHRTPYEVLTVASLVQEEGLVPSDMPKIARVIYNRLARGTPLGIDAAIFYGLGRTGGVLSPTDLAKSTPYNTRKVVGLPPTPIDAPGKAALDAALNPTPGDWQYYVLKDKAGHQFFTNDYNAFLTQKAKSMREGIF